MRLRVVLVLGVIGSILAMGGLVSCEAAPVEASVPSSPTVPIEVPSVAEHFVPVVPQVALVTEPGRFLVSVVDAAGEPLPHVPIDLIEVIEIDTEQDCDEPTHIAEHLARWRHQAPAVARPLGQTDDEGHLVLSEEPVVPDQFRLRDPRSGRTSGLLYSLKQPVELEDTPGMQAKAVQVVDVAKQPIASASVAVFDPVRGALVEGLVNAEGLYTLAPCARCLVLAQAPGFLSMVVAVEEDRTIVRLSRPGTVDVEAESAPDGSLVTLSLLHPRTAVVTNGVARFSNVPATDFLVLVEAADHDFHTRGTLADGQHLTVVIAKQRAASVIVHLTDLAGRPVEDGSMGVEPKAPGFSGWRTGVVTFGVGEPIETSRLPAGPVRLVLGAAGMRNAVRDVTLVPGANELHVALEPAEP
jgi:hypothetical protein